MGGINAGLVKAVKEMERQHGIDVDDHFGIHNELKGALVDSDMTSVTCSYYCEVDRQKPDEPQRIKSNPAWTR